MSGTGDKQPAWDAFWRTGTLSSQTTGDKVTEAPEAIDAWERFFATLPKTARILDLATGNGIVPAHANSFARANGAAFEIMAVDQADIDPLNTVADGRELLEGVTFIGGIDIEDLPFEDNWFDAVTAQFAIEYADLEKAVGEAARVLKKGGRFRFVCHASEGVITAHNVPKARQSSWLLEQSGIFETLLVAAQEAFAGSPAREESRARFRTVAVGAREAINDMGGNEELQALLEKLVEAYVMRKRFGDFEGFKAWVDGVRGEISGQIGIFEALAAAALDFKGVEKLAELLAKAGFGEIKVSELLAGPNKQLLAWQIEGVGG